MHIVAIGWIFVVLLMSLAEALSSQGSVLGAVVTFALYGMLPLSIVLYLMGAPLRRRARRRRESAQGAAADGVDGAAGDSRADGDGRRHATGPSITPVRKEP